ncbi:AAA family ATPase [Alcanivorax sp. 1008]|uniref:AAA family ATPase n=1 Tax=Alcanivorax sp. 1008 TaxID=2816853 RepID=UPI001DB1D097|nr:AAA family ATPase [Alcanivorax sp. 1008]MCC1498007.1 AAA family ATPase [Alcanivorax sp. 1008]
MSVDAAVSKIKSTKVTHRNWEEAINSAFYKLTYSEPGDVICITGPSRAGKTRLIGELARLLGGGLGDDESGIMRCVTVDAENTGPHGKFSTKAFTLKMLKAVRHPIYGGIGDDLNQDYSRSKAERATEGTLRSALESAFLNRKSRFLFIDEAQHVRYTSKDAMGAYAVLDSWKCMAKASGITLVIVGAYPILEVIGKSPHLIGRKSQIHLPRYQDNAEDFQQFRRILQFYANLIGEAAEEGVLIELEDMLYDGSLGCIGLLQQWLIRAAAQSCAKGFRISRASLEHEMLSEADLVSIAQEIRLGESILKLPDYKYVKDLNGDPGGNPKNPRKVKARKSKPFQRNPKRFKPGNRTDPDAD